MWADGSKFVIISLFKFGFRLNNFLVASVFCYAFSSLAFISFKFKFYCTFSHQQRADEHQMPKLRKCSTLVAIIFDHSSTLKSMTETISIIRQAGFFKKYGALSEDELLDTLYEIKKQEYSKMFGYDYTPERKTDIYSIVGQDPEKFLDIDLEADVCADNKVYSSLLAEISKASNGNFLPSDIEEIWNSEEGPIKVSFDSNGQIIIFEPEYMDDWIDGRIFEVINKEMKKVSNEYFHLCSGPNDEWFGQNAIYVRLTEAEKKLLIDKLEWRFPEE